MLHTQNPYLVVPRNCPPLPTDHEWRIAEHVRLLRDQRRAARRAAWARAMIWLRIHLRTKAAPSCGAICPAGKGTAI